MKRAYYALMVLFIFMNVAFGITQNLWYTWLVAGFTAGVLYTVTLEDWFERREERRMYQEISELNTLYTNQTTLFDNIKETNNND